MANLRYLSLSSSSNFEFGNISWNGNLTYDGTNLWNFYFLKNTDCLSHVWRVQIFLRCKSVIRRVTNSHGTSSQPKHEVPALDNCLTCSPNGDLVYVAKMSVIHFISGVHLYIISKSNHRKKPLVKPPKIFLKSPLTFLGSGTITSK